MRILVVTDFSAEAAEAARRGAALARQMGASLCLLHVHARTRAPHEIADLQEELDDLGLRLGGDDLAVTALLAAGDAVSQILAVATQECVDLIVLGTHGRGGLRRLFLGSVAEAVVRQASCPVMTVDRRVLLEEQPYVHR
jgi:nucleotide-binding universal stress UspA family protein